ncbi:glycine cleavage system T protein [Hirschia baltica ATCC 49814]|uniref:aminomethyltransferase n=1 Tax=Hirschia baltica (strain ATCC 49814 / DSM 5838 / IFAM 1418) TaxID=582402 RepID=C6XRB1_HIRBI|nr:glycine cleavage system T protein [Hirschia baltica ATCC 49814]
MHECVEVYADRGEPCTVSNADLKLTPLSKLNHSMGGKMVDFAGYSMPIQFDSGIIPEHHHVREKCGLFDVSHMGPAFLKLEEMGSETALTGDAAHAKIAGIFEQLVCGDIAGLAPGEMRYTLLLNDDGGILDDLMVTRPFAPEEQGCLYIVVNAGCKEEDFALISEKCEGAVLERADDNALIAVQGPLTRKLMAKYAPQLADMVFMTAKRVDVCGVNCLASCSGYTGEDGYEILVPAEHAETITKTLLEDSGIAPIGLGARDSLRLEAGLCLYGHDMDTSKTPIEASLTWAVSKVRRDEADFPGGEKIIAQIENGTDMKRIGLTLIDKAPAREGSEIATKDGKIIGVITSGGHGHTAGKPVAMGYVQRGYTQAGTELDVLVRNKPRAAVVSRMPFVKQNYYRG